MSTSQVRERLEYDPKTGIFRWKKRLKRAVVGSVAGTIRPDGYIGIYIFRKVHLAHRLAWLYVNGCWPSGELDHKDGNRKNNSIKNLRPATRVQNSYNMGNGKKNKSGLKGVSFCKWTGRWRASIRANGVCRNLGRYDDKMTAALAYDAAARKYFGEFARVNFPSESA